MYVLGVDMEDISRFVLERKQDSGFLEKVFTEAELDYCFNKHIPSQHLAARFAAKEAVYKALCSGGESSSLSLKEIEVENNEAGVPKVKLPTGISTNYKLQISISHCQDKAIAVAVASKMVGK